MDDKRYYAMMGSERVGPMSLDELRSLPLTPQTPVWRQGMANWANASTFPELGICFNSQPDPGYRAYNPPPGPPYAAPGGGYGGNQSQMPPRPDNYLVWSILVTVLCCIAGGIVALVYSSKVNSCYDRGDYEGAVSASNTARTWCIVSAVVGFIGGCFYAGTFMIGALGNMF